MGEEHLEPGQDLIALVRRAQTGDGEAFTQLFHQLHQPVLNYIYRTVGDRQAAEDITQDAFIRAHERVEAFSDRPQESCEVAGILYL